MKHCILIPCFNHSATVARIAREAQPYGPVIVVNDGSTQPLPDLPGCTLVRLLHNRGKAGALRVGFQKAIELGFTHAITMDADGQHFAEDLPRFIAAAEEQPDALTVGVRDFYSAGAPAGRRRSNAVSTFWFRVETGVRLGDTQCGFRGYPLKLVEQLKVRSERYAFELEFLVRASWVGTSLVAVPVKSIYQPEHLRHSHFRPVVDLTKITVMNIGLVLQSWVIPRALRVDWSYGRKRRFGNAVAEFFSENAQDPLRMSLAVGLGLFFGIAPIWGYQMLIAAAVAHWLRLNKTITLLASNISIPPVMPFILYGALALGHWIFVGEALDLSPSHMTRSRAFEYLWQWIVGSLALGTIVASLGIVVTYSMAKLAGRK